MSGDFLHFSPVLPHGWHSSHFLARGGDVSRCFDYPLAAVVMFVELAAKGLECGDEGRDWRCRLGGLILAARMLDACHDGDVMGKVGEGRERLAIN